MRKQKKKLDVLGSKSYIKTQVFHVNSFSPCSNVYEIIHCSMINQGRERHTILNFSIYFISINILRFTGVNNKLTMINPSPNMQEKKKWKRTDFVEKYISLNHITNNRWFTLTLIIIIIGHMHDAYIGGALTFMGNI